MSQALFDELEVTGDVLFIWSGHQQLGAHWRGEGRSQPAGPPCCGCRLDAQGYEHTDSAGHSALCATAMKA